jgi:hypothetical protein
MDSSKALRGSTRRSHRDSQLRCRGRRPGLVPGLPLPTKALQPLAASRRRSGLRVGAWEPGNLETCPGWGASAGRQDARDPSFPGFQRPSQRKMNPSFPGFQLPSRPREPRPGYAEARDSNPLVSRHKTPLKSLVGPPGIPGASMRHRSLAWGSRANLEPMALGRGECLVDYVKSSLTSSWMRLWSGVTINGLTEKAHLL